MTISVTGWGNDPDSQRLYAFFKGGNGYLLQKMKTVFDVGPIQTADYRALGLMARLKVRVHGMKTSYTPRADQCLACGNREPHQAFRRRSPISLMPSMACGRPARRWRQCSGSDPLTHLFGPTRGG